MIDVLIRNLHDFRVLDVRPHHSRQSMVFNPCRSQDFGQPGIEGRQKMRECDGGIERTFPGGLWPRMGEI